VKTLVVHLNYFYKKPSSVVSIDFTEHSVKPLKEKIEIDFKKLKNISSDIYEYVNQFYLKNSKPRESEIAHKLKVKGRLLFETLFGNELQFREIDTIIFSIDKELIFVPFELIYDNNFWGLKYRIARQIKFRAPTSMSWNIKELNGIIISNPSEDKRIEKILKRERESIYNILRKTGNIKVSPPYAGRIVHKKFFINSLLENNIIYFSGHSVSENKSNTYVQLYKSRLKPDDLKELNLSHIKIYFSNSCQSTFVKKGIYFKHTILYSFLKSGIQNYIGNVFNIKPESASYFAEEFFKNICKGKNFGDAILIARKKVWKQYGFKDIAWFSYTFYGDPEEKLINTKKWQKFIIILFALILLGISLGRLIKKDVENKISESGITESINQKNIIIKSKTLAILPFGYYDESLKNIVEKIMDKFYRRFQQTYRLVEREKIDEVLKELKLSESKYIDKTQAIKIGKLISARYMLYGRVYREDNKIRVHYRIIDVETSEIKYIGKMEME